MSDTQNFFNSADVSKLGAPIWERLFLTSMNYKDSLSTDDIRRFGMPTVGDSTIDADMQNHLIDKYLTIDQMVEFYKQGIPIYVKIHKETKDIYDIISAYLLCWKQNLENGINIGGAPIEDLINLDRFATTVYAHAVEHFTEEFIHSNIINYIGTRKVGRAAFAKKEEVYTTATEPEVKQRESLATLFSDRVYSARSRVWK